MNILNTVAMNGRQDKAVVRHIEHLLYWIRYRHSRYLSTTTTSLFSYVVIFPCFYLAISRNFIFFYFALAATVTTIVAVAMSPPRKRYQFNTFSLRIRLELVNDLLKIIDVANKASARPHELARRAEIPSLCHAAAKKFESIYKVPRLRPGQSFAPSTRRLIRREAQIAANKLKSYEISYLSDGNKQLVQTRDDFCRILLRVACGSWSEVLRDDIGLSSKSSSRIGSLIDSEHLAVLGKIGLAILTFLTSIVLLIAAVVKSGTTP